MANLYSKYKVFHYKEKIDSLPAHVDEIKPPVHIRIKPTNICNHNCSYCAYRSENLQLGCGMVKTDYIPRSKILEIMDDIIEMQIKAVTFSGGGEPLCYPHLLDAVKKLVDSPVRFASLTNGSLLKGEIAELFSHHATWIRVSMDGTDSDSYAKYRQCDRREFKKVMSNMRSFKQLGGSCYLGVSLIVDDRNVNTIYSFAEQLKELGIDSIKFSPCIVSNIAAKNNAYHRTIFHTARDQISRALDHLNDASFEIYDSYHTLDEKFAKNYSWCPYCQILPVIGADLNIYSCQDKAYNFEEGMMGTIKDARFKDFWFSDKKNFFRINPSLVCNHHCVANSKNKMIIEYLSMNREHLPFV